MSLRFDRLLSLLSAGTLLLVSPGGHAASFDHLTTASVAEKTIWANYKLSELDEKLADAWANVSGIGNDPVTRKSSELQWLKLRDACGADASCLSARYHERLAALVNAQFPVAADQAGNHLEALTPQDEFIDVDPMGCTANEQFRVQLHTPADAPAEMQIDYAGEHPFGYRLTLPDTGPKTDTGSDADTKPDTGPVTVTLWPRVLRLAGDNDTIWVGAVYEVLASYSGGGGRLSELRLFRVSRDEAASSQVREVLSVPIHESLSIRACFSEQDERRRRGNCRDEYNFKATLGLDRTVKSGLPRLVYQTRATGFSRNKDTRCTYKRIFHFKTSSGVYMPDRPLPNCDEYTNP